MPKGELFINGLDAYEEYGVSMQSSGLSALMTPPPNKEMIENKSRQEHGKRIVYNNPKIDERELTLPIHITASTRNDFFMKYEKFCNVLAQGRLDISTSYQPNVVYRTIYQSCTQFAEYRLGLAKFTLKLNEPNPMNRIVE